MNQVFNFTDAIAGGFMYLCKLTALLHEVIFRENPHESIWRDSTPQVVGFILYET